MTIQSVRAAIATVASGVTGIKRAYAQLPRGPLVEADLPACMSYVREAENDFAKGSDTGIESRLYLVHVVVLPVAMGTPGEGESLVEPFIELVRDAFASRPSLGNVVGVQYSRVVGDTGVRQLVWADTPYWGVEFRLRVYSMFNVDYQDYE